MSMSAFSSCPPALSPGFSMPAEWSPHAACWLAWPQRKELWGDYLAGACADYARVARAIARREPVVMVADPSSASAARVQCGDSVEVVELALDDSWLRDSAPTFLVDAQGRREAATFVFNAWGRKFESFGQDATLGTRIAQHRGIPARRSELVVEGGGFQTDGEGTLITAETCVLNPNRNPHWTKQQAERELCRVLGVTQVIWLPGDVTETGTDGHVDGYLSYIRPATLLWETVADPLDPRFEIMAENRRVLETSRDARGRPFELVPIPEAPRSVVPADSPYFCRSYVNLYLANGAVIAPAYGIAEDDVVRDTLVRALPGHAIDMVPLHDLFRGGGGIHCITQQEPAAVADRPA